MTFRRASRDCTTSTPRGYGGEGQSWRRRRQRPTVGSPGVPDDAVSLYCSTCRRLRQGLPILTTAHHTLYRLASDGRRERLHVSLVRAVALCGGSSICQAIQGLCSRKSRSAHFRQCPAGERRDAGRRDDERSGQPSGERNAASDSAVSAAVSGAPVRSKLLQRS